MTNYKSKIIVVLALAALQGCAGLVKAPGEVAAPFKDSEVTYLPQKFTSTTFANSSPQDLKGVESDTLKVLALLGYPTIKSHPVDKFTHYQALNSNKESVEEFFAGNAPVAKTGSSVAQDFFMTAGLAGDIAPGGAIAGAVLTGSGMGKTDPRIDTSTALCFKPVAEYDAAAALAACFQDVDSHITSAFVMRKPLYRLLDQFVYEVTFQQPGGLKPAAYLSFDRLYSDHSLGYAPADRGGYKAHLIKIRFTVRPDSSSAAIPYKSEDLVGVFTKNKPDSLVYLISPASGRQGGTDVEPFGIY